MTAVWSGVHSIVEEWQSLDRHYLSASQFFWENWHAERQSEWNDTAPYSLWDLFRWRMRLSRTSLMKLPLYPCSWLSKIDAPRGRVSTSISWWKTPILDEIEPIWQPLEGTHNPVGTYLIVWIGDNHGHSWNLDWTRRKRQRRGTSYAQLGGPTRYHHKL